MLGITASTTNLIYAGAIVLISGGACATFAALIQKVESRTNGAVSAGAVFRALLMGLVIGLILAAIFLLTKSG